MAVLRSEGVLLPLVHDLRTLQQPGQICLELPRAPLACSQNQRGMRRGGRSTAFEVGRCCPSRRGWSFASAWPILIGAGEGLRCYERVALLQSLKNDIDIPIRLQVGDGSVDHDLRGREVQAERHDGMRIRQQHECVRIARGDTEKSPIYDHRKH